MITKQIIWKSLINPAPLDRRILIAAPGVIKTGKALIPMPGEENFACDDGLLIHNVFAWAELPEISPDEVK